MESRSPKPKCHFYCSDCKVGWEAEPERVEDNPDAPWHPFDYFATREDCPCGLEKRQAVWERNLLKAHAHATGPTTDEGKAKSAANLDGHPTPDESRITRLNALKHGLYAKTAPYFPARPGKYPQCESCEHLNNGCNDLLHREPEHVNPPACLKRVELHMQHMIAFEHKDPNMLTHLTAQMQARVHAIVDNMILEILNTGAAIRTPEWTFNAKGEFKLVDFIDDEHGRVVVEKVQAHPLIKPLIEFLRVNGMTLPDSGMTLRSQDDHDLLKGYLQGESKPSSSEEYQRRSTLALEGMERMIRRSAENTRNDPILVQHQQEAIEDDS